MIQEKMTKYDLCWNKNKNLAKKKKCIRYYRELNDIRVLG